MEIGREGEAVKTSFGLGPNFFRNVSAQRLMVHELGTSRERFNRSIGRSRATSL